MQFVINFMKMFDYFDKNSLAEKKDVTLERISPIAFSLINDCRIFSLSMTYSFFYKVENY